MYKLDKKLDGYMSLEAAFLVPWVIFIIGWMMYLGYFQYDRALLFQDNYTVATQTAAYIASVDNKQNRLTGLLSNSSIKRKYVCANTLSLSGQVSDRSVIMQSEVGVKAWKATDYIDADNFSFTKRLRTYRTVGRILD